MKSRSLTWVGRVSVAMAALLALAIAATPAVAAPPQPYLKVDIPGGGVAPGSAGMPLPDRITDQSRPDPATRDHVDRRSEPTRREPGPR